MFERAIARSGRIYHRTEAGDAALANRRCSLPEDYRRLLRRVRIATPVAALTAGGTSDCETLGRLEDLEAIGLVEHLPADWIEHILALESYLPRPLDREA
jgi:hypothetical protein